MFMDMSKGTAMQIFSGGCF